MVNALSRSPFGFELGLTTVIDRKKAPDIGIDFHILRLTASEQFIVHAGSERALLLMNGHAIVQWDDRQIQLRRASLFNEAPCALHLDAQTVASVCAVSDCEFAVVATVNEKLFEAQVFHHGSMLENEHRGQGLLDDTAYRIVRTIFDKRNRPTSNLVLGEVITFPGRWSSYPPHFHAQPEIYHYRFTEPQGYGHAELGDDVFKVRACDTLAILDGKTHAQVSAPGYGMYYLWAIRHLPNNPYILPTFVDEHTWTKSPGANARVWKMS